MFNLLLHSISNINGLCFLFEDKQRHYSKVNDSLGVHITLHPVSFIRVAADACQSVTLMCAAVSDTVIQYKWIKDGQVRILYRSLPKNQ
jgi:hypothetical protein